MTVFKKIFQYVKTHKKVFIPLSVVMGLLGIGLTLWEIRDEKAVPTSVLTQSEGFIRELVPLDNDVDYGVSTTSAYRVKTRGEISEKELKASLSITPENAYTLESVSNKEYVIHFEKAFTPNTIIQMAFNREGATQGWAFQTQKLFKVSATLPNDGITYAPLNTGIEIYFTKDAPMGIELYFTITPEVEGYFEYHANEVIFIPHEDLLDDTQYTITISKAYGYEGETLGEDYSFSFHTERQYAQKPFCFYNLSAVMKSTQQVLEFYLDEAQVTEKEIAINLYTLSGSKNYMDVMDSVYKREYAYDPFKGIMEQVVYSEMTTMTAEIKSVATEYETRHYIELPTTLPLGYYLVEVLQDKNYAYQLLQVCDYQAYVAITEDDVLTWIVDPNLGKPAQGLKIELNGQTLGETNEEGLLVAANTLELDKDQIWHPLVTDSEGNSFVIDMKGYYYDSYYYYGYDEMSEEYDYWEFFYTDRELYLPTDTIHVFGFAQRKDGAELSEVKVRLVYGDLILDSKVLTVTENGSYQCEFDVVNYLKGSAGIEVYDGEKLIHSEYVSINYFEKPTYTVDAEVSKEMVMVGDSIEVAARARFFEGTPVVGGTMTLSSNYSFNNGQYSIGLSCDENGESLANITPDPGYNNSWWPYYFQINLSTDAFAESYDFVRRGFTFYPRDAMMELDVTAVDKAEVVTVDTEDTNDTEVVIEEGTSVDDASNLSSYLVTADLHAIDIQGLEEASYDPNDFRGKALSGHSITLTIRENYSERIKTGQIYDYINKVTVDLYKYNYIENIISTETVVTDEKGHYEFMFTKPYEDRNYTFVFNTTDQSGNSIQMEQGCWDYVGYYSSDDTPYLYTEKTEYKRNETVTASVYSMQKPIKDTEENCALFITCKNGFITHEVKKDLTTSFQFDELYISNAYIIGLYFDGKQIHQLNDQYLYFDYKATEELTVEMETDKMDYRPGEDVTFKVNVTDVNGNPVSADINISVVDESYFTIIEDSSDPLSEIYRYVNRKGILRSAVFKPTDLYQNQGGAEMGGGGDYTYRDDFDTTAFFNTITTDANGEGTLTFTLPDNLTSWRITGTALTQDLKAGKSKININAKLPFFITEVLYDTYLVGDEISATVITSGTEVTSQMDIDYEIKVENEQGTVSQGDYDGKGLVYSSLPLGTLEAGTYTVTLSAKSGERFDGIKKTINVVPSMQFMELTKKEPLQEEMTWTANGNLVDLYFINEKAAEHYQKVLELYNVYGSKRIDIMAAAYTAGSYLNEVYGAKLPLDFVDSLKDEARGGLFYESDVMSFQNLSLVDHQITPFVLLSDLYQKDNWFSEEELATISSGLEQQLTSPDVSTMNNFAAMWGLAIMEEPVLVQVQKALFSEPFTNNTMNFEKIYTLLSLIELGDLERAKAVYEELMEKYSIQSERYITIQGGDTKKLTAMMMLAAIFLDKTEDADKMYTNLMSMPDYLFPTNMERVIYLKAREPESTTCSFGYELGGTREEVQLEHRDMYHLTLRPEEVDQIKFNNIVGDVSVISDFIGTIDQIQPTNQLSVVRTYLKDGVPVTEDSIQLGDRIVVKLDITLLGNEWCFEVDDILPAGFAYYTDGSYQNYYFIENHGNRVHINGYKQPNLTTQTISYTAVAISKGTYVADYVVIKNRYNFEANYEQRQYLTIN